MLADLQTSAIAITKMSYAGFVVVSGRKNETINKCQVDSGKGNGFIKEVIKRLVGKRTQ
jgi:hypothetical protein